MVVDRCQEVDPFDLSLSDLRVDESSYVDPNGFLFHYQNGVYRAVRPRRESFVKALFDDGTVGRLTSEHGLVESRLTSYKITAADCRLVVAHERISPLSYCVEWCPSMLKEAAVTTLDLASSLVPRGCTLQDAYPWNVLFRGNRSVFVDLTSIVPIESGLLWPAYQQFIDFFQNPLELCADGKGKLARALLFDSIHGVRGADVRRAFSLSYRLSHPVATLVGLFTKRVESRLQADTGLKARLQAMAASETFAAEASVLRSRFFGALRRRISRLRVRSPRSNWKAYYAELEPAPDRKVATVRSLLRGAGLRTVLDLGCNVGRYSVVAAEEGYRVTAVDASEDCIEQLFHQARERDLAILPLIVDVLAPTPAFGHLARQFPAMPERLRSDVVLCLGLLHHLHVTGRQSFDRIAELLDALCHRAVILEYVDVKDGNLDRIDHGRKIDYDLGTVRQALASRFRTTVFDSDRETRKLLWCEKD